jgi:1-acyl-sn-glycerol-3-phosphate acyltransferase
VGVPDNRHVTNTHLTQQRSSLTYRIVMAVATPIVRWWSRLHVVGLDILPSWGPVVLMVNHDSAWDPVVVGVAAGRRQIHALAKSSLWHPKPLGWVLDHMGQIPIERGRGDLTAMSAAVTALEQGRCLGVFPEGTVSRGRALRALSGAGRLALAVPGTRVIGVSVTGVVDIVRFPRRPRIRVEFFDPAAGQPQPGESAVALTKRTMAEVRAGAPYAVPGRRKSAAKYRQLAEVSSTGGAVK